MKPTLQRMLFEIVNFLMALLFIIPVGVLIEQMCGYPLYRCCLIPCISSIGFIVGRFSLKSSATNAIILCIAAFLISTVLTLALSWNMGLATILLTICTAFFSIFFFFSARKAAYTIYAPMAIGGIILHLGILLCCAGFHWDAKVNRFTSIISICFFLLTLFSFSAKGLRRSMYRGSGDKRVIYPACMQMGNFLLVTGFILAAVFISNIYPIFHLFSQGFTVFLNWLISALAFLSSLFERKTVSTVPEEESVSEIPAEDNIMNVEPKGEASWITTGVEIFAFLCVMLLVIYAVYKLIQRIHASGIRIPNFLQNLRDKFAPIAEEDYIDETENLFDMKKVLSDTRSNIKKAFAKLRERPQKIEDFPDNRTKVRFAFQQLLKKVKARNPNIISQTPNEIYEKEYAGDQNFREFMDYYNQAKYSNRPLTNEAADCAKEILKQK